MLENPEQRLALSYAPRAARSGLAALWALDARLGGLLRHSSDPMVAQLRLTWWHEALTALDKKPPPAEPLLAALAADLLPRGVRGARLAGMIDGWEALLDADPLDDARLEAYAVARGAVLFELAGVVCGAATPALTDAGAGWALADLSRHVRDREVAATARQRGRDRLDRAFAVRWPASLRALGALAALARRDVMQADAVEPIGSPARIATMLRHRITGR